MGAGQSVPKTEASTQTDGGVGDGSGSNGNKKKKKNGNAEYPQEILNYSSDEIREMILLFKEKQAAIDRTSIRGVQAKKDLYDSLDKNSDKQSPTVNRPRFDPNSLHRQNHPKGYLTKITTDYEAQHDEELTVQKGTMVKVLRNHKDGRYEIYTAGGFGLVPGKVLAYIQYEPDYN